MGAGGRGDSPLDQDRLVPLGEVFIDSEEIHGIGSSAGTTRAALHTKEVVQEGGHEGVMEEHPTFTWFCGDGCTRGWHPCGGGDLGEDVANDYGEYRQPRGLVTTQDEHIIALTETLPCTSVGVKRKAQQDSVNLNQ